MDQPGRNFQNQESTVINDDEITKAGTKSNSNAEVTVPSYWQSVLFRRSNQSMLEKVQKGTSTYVNVARSFLNGMKNYENDIDVIGIYRKNYDDGKKIDKARMEAFRKAVLRINGGNPNIKYGWYGGSREQIGNILCYGFHIRSGLYGLGVYFSSANNSDASLKLTPDSDGVMHILLCLVILGKSEQIPFGSRINQPTSTEFHSGVDDISNPQKYIIWERHMKDIVLPVFIVSFKSNPLTREQRARSLALTKTMIMRLPNHVSHSKMAFVKKLYDEFTQKKITEGTFRRNLTIIAGVDVIRKLLQCYIDEQRK